MNLTEREQKLVNACVDYAENHAEAGLPGHNLMILVTKLLNDSDELHQRVKELDRLAEKTDEYWKDIIVGWKNSETRLRNQIADLEFQLETLNK